MKLTRHNVISSVVTRFFVIATVVNVLIAGSLAENENTVARVSGNNEIIVDDFDKGKTKGVYFMLR